MGCVVLFIFLSHLSSLFYASLSLPFLPTHPQKRSITQPSQIRTPSFPPHFAMFLFSPFNPYFLYPSGVQAKGSLAVFCQWPLRLLPLKHLSGAEKRIRISQGRTFFFRKCPSFLIVVLLVCLHPPAHVVVLFFIPKISFTDTKASTH